MKFTFAARLAGLAIAFALAGALLPGAASAGSASANLTVNANVVANCTIGAQTFNLGNYDPITNASTALDTSDSTIAVTCTKGHNVQLAANAGANSGQGSCSTNRALKNSTNYLCYDLYTDAGLTTVWGDGAGLGSTITLTPTTGLAATTTTIYADVPAGQDAVYAGTAYTDTVGMTVNF